MSIGYIYFDLGKVLFDFDHTIGCQQVAAISGCTAEKVNSILFESGLEDSFETGHVDADEFHKQFCEASGGSPSLEDFLNACSDIFSMNTPMMPLIGQLAAVGYPMGILSNTCSAHWNQLFKRYRFLQNSFRDYILSYESKSMKPDQKIYQDAIKTAALPANEIFFIDDKPENVQGAIAAGMDAVLYKAAKTVAIAKTAQIANPNS